MQICAAHRKEGGLSDARTTRRCLRALHNEDAQNERAPVTIDAYVAISSLINVMTGDVKAPNRWR